jgi:hypothetical protein
MKVLTLRIVWKRNVGAMKEASPAEVCPNKIGCETFHGSAIISSSALPWTTAVRNILPLNL